MAQFQGIEDFVGAMFGGGALERQAYDAATQRLIGERSRRAMMDKRVFDSYIAGQKAEQLSGLNALIDDPLLRALTVSGTGGSYSSAQTGLGTGQQNAARGVAQEIVNQLIAGGQAPGVDGVNLLLGIAGDKLLAPTNVNVQRQAAARALEDEAQARSADASANLRTTQADLLVPAQAGAADALTALREGTLAAIPAPIAAADAVDEYGGSVEVPVGETLYDLAPKAFGPVAGLSNMLGQGLDLIPGLGLPEGSAENVAARSRYNRVLDELRRSLSTTRAYKELEEITKKIDLNPSSFTGDDTARTRILALHNAMVTSMRQQEQDAVDPALDKKARAEAARSARLIRNTLPKLVSPDVIAGVQSDSEPTGAIPRASAEAMAAQVGGFADLPPEDQEELIRYFEQGGQR